MEVAIVAVGMKVASRTPRKTEESGVLQNKLPHVVFVIAEIFFMNAAAGVPKGCLTQCLFDVPDCVMTVPSRLSGFYKCFEYEGATFIFFLHTASRLYMNI